MTGRFLIAGMPRCRTAWFSVVMSTIKSVCFHEPTANLQSFDDLIAFWAPDPGLHIGVSDSGLTLQLGRILETVQPRTLLIERPIPDVSLSLKKYFKGSSLMFDYDKGRALLGRMQESIDRHRDHPLVRVASFEALRDQETVAALAQWLAPDIDILDLRAMMHMNVQADREYVVGLINKPHSNWHLEPWKTSEKSAAE